MKPHTWLLGVGLAFLGNAGTVSGPKLAPPAADSLPSAPGPIVVGKMGLVSAGDTLPYTISWGPGARATSYTVSLSVAATNGAWSVARDSNASSVAGGAWPATNGLGPLPQTAAVTFTSLKTWVSAVPWDSATFTVTVFSQNSIGASATGSTRIWRVLRRPGPPGPITIDSSLIIIGLWVQPNAATVALGGSRTYCAFQQFGNGAVTEWTADKPSCDSLYVGFIPITSRAIVTAAQQAHTDSLNQTCVTWTTNNALAVSLTPNAPCSSAVSVTGLQLTMRPDQILFRNVRASAGPVFLVAPDGKATCLRPGIQTITATIEGVIGQVTLTCRPALPSFLAEAQP